MSMLILLIIISREREGRGVSNVVGQKSGTNENTAENIFLPSDTGCQTLCCMYWPESETNENITANTFPSNGADSLTLRFSCWHRLHKEEMNEEGGEEVVSNASWESKPQNQVRVSESREQLRYVCGTFSSGFVVTPYWPAWKVWQKDVVRKRAPTSSIRLWIFGSVSNTRRYEIHDSTLVVPTVGQADNSPIISWFGTRLRERPVESFPLRIRCNNFGTKTFERSSILLVDVQLWAVFPASSLPWTQREREREGQLFVLSSGCAFLI